MDELLSWFETHQVTVDIIQWISLLLIAWFSGLFRFIRSYTVKPIFEIVPTASMVFIEKIKEHDKHRELVRASFIINAGLVNRTNERIVLDKAYLSYETEKFWRRYKQQLLHVVFPSRPRKQVGTVTKLMSVFFTEYSEENGRHEVITGILEPKDKCGGYLLFVSFTYGNWNPKIRNGRINVKLTGVLTSGEKITSKASLRIEQSKEVIEKFSPGLLKHIANEATWNHDLSVIK